MSTAGGEEFTAFMAGLVRRNPGEPEFHQAVGEFAATILPFIADKPIYREMQILERMTEPDRIITFRVCWEDDQHRIRTQRGYRVQCNNAIGPYKGGIRFHHDLTASILKFLAFEQTFKNSLTGLPMGGAKGGADFNPRDKSANEVMRFCQSFMIELHRHIGPDTDVPAGDIGVGVREIGYLFGQYKRLENKFVGALTGKGLEFGGSKIRTEATGHGAVYMLDAMLKHRGGETLAGRKVNISGSGNVACYAAEKVLQLGGTVQTMSDSSGYIYDPDGINEERLAYLINLKQVCRGRIAEYTREHPQAEFHEGRPWLVPCDIALPCATQNEINGDDARLMIKNGLIAVCEGANMPSDHEAIEAFKQAKILFAPGKAANAGGVAVSGMEMSQNSGRTSWQEDDVEKLLRSTMTNIHASCVEYGGEGSDVDYVKGANIAGFIKVANAMLAYGVI